MLLKCPMHAFQEKTFSGKLVAGIEPLIPQVVTVEGRRFVQLYKDAGYMALLGSGHVGATSNDGRLM